MKTYFVTFRSITFAQRGESILRKAGMDSTLQRTPRWMEAQGCGYCLKLNEWDINQAAALLQQKQIPFRKIYLRQENGETKEVRL